MPFSASLAGLFDEARERGDGFFAGVFEMTLGKSLRHRRGRFGRTGTDARAAGKADDLIDEAGDRETAGGGREGHLETETVFQAEGELGGHQRVDADFGERTEQADVFGRQ